MTSWKVSLPCTRAEAEAIDAAEDVAEGVVLMTTEIEEDDREHWRLDAYLEAEPTPETIAAICALVPSAAGAPPVTEKLEDEDWVTLSQQGLEPIAEGRFVVHTSAHPVAPPPGGRAFLIEAGQAFGTGHHATTSGCLAMLDGMADWGFDNIIDVGTGTGLLAFAARHLWPGATIVATDIDPRAIVVTRENAELNAIPAIDLIVADGALDDSITARAPYDLLIANILAGPLVSMASEIAA
ncbi:MAG: 50S ribosomal protein L11 methyltransferase, partial [Pseudomonadota bacterium]